MSPLKKCKVCGKVLSNPRYPTCYDCHNKPAALPKNYLINGYFDEKGNLYEDLITDTASLLAYNFGKGRNGLTTSQLRRFFSHVRAVENRLNMLGSYNLVKSEIQKLKPFAAEAFGKNKIPKVFYKFIEKNMALVKDKKSFKNGFIEHFQAVVAYFYYHHPRK